MNIVEETNIYKNILETYTLKNTPEFIPEIRFRVCNKSL